MRKTILITILLSVACFRSFAQKTSISTEEPVGKPLFPEVLEGNWLKTDGSNEWTLGFDDNVVIYGNEFWENAKISGDGKNYELRLQKKEISKTLFITMQADSNLLIGTATNNMELYSRKKTLRKDYILATDEDFPLPFFKTDTSTCKGYIKGYLPEMGKTGTMYLHNVITGMEDTNVIKIEPDGRFESRFLICHPQIIQVNILNRSIEVYVEPGKQTILFLNSLHKSQKPLFMGDLARVNADLYAIESRSSDYVFDKVRDMNPMDCKAYCLDFRDKNLKKLTEYQADNKLCKKALKMRQMTISQSTGINILSYFMEKEEKHSKNQPDRPDVSRCIDSLPAEYFDFIHPDELNNPFSMTALPYYLLVNRINYCSFIYPNSFKIDSLTTDSLLKDIYLSKDERIFLQKKSLCKSDSEIDTLNNRNKVIWDELCSKKDIARIFASFKYIAIKNNCMRYFHLSPGLVTGLMQMQEEYARVKATNKPIPEWKKQALQKELHDPFFADYMIRYSKAKEDEIIKTRIDNQSKTGYTIHKTPAVEGDKVFDAIMQKYKGKVIFVDFWATWCGPCKDGIRKMAPIKEELKDKEVVFVYLTNESSGPDTWKLLIPDIKGEHYFLTMKEWKCLESRFKFNSIPHYTLVNKAGEVVKDGIQFTWKENEFKDMIGEYLK